MSKIPGKSARGRTDNVSRMLSTASVHAQWIHCFGPQQDRHVGEWHGGRKPLTYDNQETERARRRCPRKRYTLHSHASSVPLPPSRPDSWQPLQLLTHQHINPLTSKSLLNGTTSWGPSLQHMNLLGNASKPYHNSPNKPCNLGDLILRHKVFFTKQL